MHTASLLLLVAVAIIAANAQNITYTVTGLDRNVATINDVIAVYGNFSGATLSTAQCQFTIYIVNSTFDQTGETTTQFSAPQIVSSSTVTCKITFQTSANSKVYVNVVSSTSSATIISSVLFVYLNSDTLKLYERFLTLSDVNCGSSVSNSIGCPSQLSTGLNLITGNTFNPSYYVNRTAISSTTSTSGLFMENFVDFEVQASSSGNGQWIEVWQYGVTNNLMTSLEKNGSNSYINLVIETPTAYYVTKQVCAFTTATSYRLLVRAVQPTTGIDWTIRGDLIQIPSLSIDCTVTYTATSFNYTEFYSGAYTVMFSMSNALYTAMSVNKAETPSFSAASGSDSSLAVLLSVNSMVIECQDGTCDHSLTQNTSTTSVNSTTPSKLNPVPIIVVCVVLAGIALIGAICAGMIHFVRVKRCKVKPHVTEVEKVSGMYDY